MIGIRVDANTEIAMGHIMRCLSIASYIQEKEEVVFIVSESFAEKYVTDKGFRCVCLNNSYHEKELEVEQLLDIVDKYEINKLLIDSYQITKKYMTELSNRTRLFYIDDINAFRYPAEMVINYTYSADRSIYEKWGYENTSFLLGSEYIPLRNEFSRGAIHIKPKVESVFITTGGTDPYNMILELLERMQFYGGFSELKKRVVVGAFYSNIESLKQLAERYNNIEIYQNVTNMDEIMRSCDVAVSAGGTTLAELGACGIPTVCFSMADNQVEGARAYSDDNLLVYAGDIRYNKDKVIEKIIENLVGFKSDIKRREELHMKMIGTIDGNGARRIAEAILNC